MQLKSELPEGWAECQINDIITINYGKGLKKSNRIEGQFHVFGSNGIVGKHNKCLTNGPTIIIGRKGSVGEINFSSESCWPIDTTYYIDNFYGINRFFLYSLLKTLNLANYDTSTAIPGINRNDIYSLVIPLPPLAEQHRIVSAIDALVSRLDAANERLDRVPEILKKFRQSVLAAACEGGLTEDWREENQIKKDSWSDLEFFDFCVLKRGYDLPLSKRREGPYPIMTSSGIAAYHDEYKMSGPGVVVGRSGSTGRVHYIDKDYWPHNTTLFVKDFKSNFTRFVYFFLINFDLKQYGASTAVPTLNRNNLRGIVVSIPPLPEQHEIVRRVDALFALADSIEAKVAAARERTEKLRQSILAKAFSGELVETEAELARREGRDYEPADVLLERIKSEQGMSWKKGKAAKGKSTHRRE